MTEYVGSEQVMVDTWVELQLAAVAGDLNGIDAGLADRVYQDMAPRDAEFPVIIYQCQDPPRDVRGVGLTTVMVDTLYLVKAVAQVDAYAPLAPIASVIHAALTTSIGGSVGDGSVFTSVRERQFALTEVDDGKKVRHLGGLYRIQAQG